jgi:hypothetical protein
VLRLSQVKFSKPKETLCTILAIASIASPPLTQIRKVEIFDLGTRDLRESDDPLWERDSKLTGEDSI